MKKKDHRKQNPGRCGGTGRDAESMYMEEADQGILKGQEAMKIPKVSDENKMTDRSSCSGQSSGNRLMHGRLWHGSALKDFGKELLSVSSLTLLMTASLFLTGCGQKQEAQVQLWEQIPGQESTASETAEEGQAQGAGTATDSKEASAGQEGGLTGQQETGDSEGGAAGQEAAEVGGDGTGQKTAGLPEMAGWTKAPVLSPSQWVNNRYAQDGTLLVDGMMETMEVSGAGYETVSAAVRSWWEKEEQEFSKAVEEYQQLVEDPEDRWPYFAGCYYHLETYCTRADSSVISFQCLHQAYSGGAHGSYWSDGVNFRVSTGKQLSFWDLSGDKQAFSDQTLALCLEQLDRIGEELYPDYESVVRERWQEEPEWYMDGAGITVVFTPYEIATYARGEVKITLPYQDLEGLLLPEFQMGTRAGMAVLPEEQEASLCLGKTGERYPVKMLAEDVNPEEAGFRRYSLQVGEQQQQLVEWDYLGAAYLIQREDGRSFLLFYGDYASEDYETHVYELTDGQIRRTQEPLGSATIQGNRLTPDVMELEVRVDALGTYRASAPYRLTEEGTLEVQQEWYHIVMGYGEGQGILTNKRELPVVMNGVHTMLPAGSRIRLTGTDLKSRLSFTLPDSGEEGEIHYTRPEDDWQIYIDGVSEYEYFDDLPYAG